MVFKPGTRDCPGADIDFQLINYTDPDYSRLVAIVDNLYKLAVVLIVFCLQQ